MNITCLYSCEHCKLKNAAVDVPARTDEDVVKWMDRTVAIVARDHRRRSPLCRATELTELKVPMTGADRIGGPPVN